ncbi:uncharacterized protein RJT20DRAFT_147526 [Scheffersomyces xylosifermentans]|uniref:uncharacterized protein n=1 Tax=Scheffersomyces xylosifermentans TaxID=1304137 RepID=UPI00315D76CF
MGKKKNAFRRKYIAQYAQAAWKTKMPNKFQISHRNDRMRKESSLREIIMQPFFDIHLSPSEFCMTKLPKYMPFELHIYDIDLLLLHRKIPECLSKARIGVLCLTDYVTEIPKFQYNIEVVYIEKVSVQQTQKPFKARDIYEFCQYNLTTSNELLVQLAMLERPELSSCKLVPSRLVFSDALVVKEIKRHIYVLTSKFDPSIFNQQI